MLLYLTDYLAQFESGFQRIQLPDDARDSRRANGADNFLHHRSAHDQEPERQSARAARS